MLGTPYYMSPEQARGDARSTAAADIYSLGVMLYEMLIGRVPISGDNYNQLMYRVMMSEYTPPRQLRPEIPEELERLIVHAMASDPAHRPSSAEEFERALLGFCRPTFRDNTIERISAQQMGGGFSPSLTPSPMSKSGRAHRRSARRRPSRQGRRPRRGRRAARASSRSWRCS